MTDRSDHPGGPLASTLDEIVRLQMLVLQYSQLAEAERARADAAVTALRYLYERVPSLFRYALNDAEMQGHAVGDLDPPRVRGSQATRRAQ